MDTNESVALTEEPVGNSEELLSDIAEEQRQLEEKRASPEPTPEPPVEEPLVEPPDSEVDKPPQAEPPSGSDAAPVPFAKDGKADTEEWMKKKGFKDVQAMASSLRNLERELHSRASSQDPEPEAPPPEQPARARQPYGAPPANVEQMARHYNTEPEDLERVSRIAGDIAGYEINRQLKPMVSEIKRLNQELDKRNTHDSVESDPTFRDPHVLREMHEIVEKNPSITKRNPHWMKVVHTEALTNIGRRYLEGGITPEAAPVLTGQGLNRPPPSKGGSGQGRAGSPLRLGSDEMTPEQFAKLSVDNQEKYLRKKGALLDD